MRPAPALARMALAHVAALTGHDIAVLRSPEVTPLGSLVRLAAGAAAALVACAWCGIASGWATRLASDSSAFATALGIAAAAFVLCLVRLDVVGCGLPLGWPDEATTGWRPALTPAAVVVLLATSLAQPSLLWLEHPGPTTMTGASAGAGAHYGARITAAWEHPRRMVVRTGLLAAVLALLLSARRLDHRPTLAYERARTRLYRRTVSRVHGQAVGYAEAWCRSWCEQEPARDFHLRPESYGDPPFNTRPLPFGGYVTGSVIEGRSWREAVGPEPEASPGVEA